jgi:hypothetical protein
VLQAVPSVFNGFYWLSAAPCDMICNMDSKRARAGRPIGSVKLLARDPWRYLYALTQTAIEKTQALNGPSELRICEAFAAFKVGRPAKVSEVVIDRGNPISITESFHDRWERGLPFCVIHRQWDGMPDHTPACFRGDEPGARWWERNKFRPAADNMRRTLRLWRRAPATNPNRQWLAGMLKIMLICFDGRDEHAGLAESIAAAIGEGRYFAEKLRPIMIKYADLRRAGVDNRGVPPISQVIDLIYPDYAPGPNYLPNDAA